MELDRGFPVPLVSRPVNTLFDATPHYTTITHGTLVIGHRVFEHPAAGKVKVVLDFRFRDRLDQITWSSSNRLPTIATLHPFLGGGRVEIGEQNEEWFFDVRPSTWRADETLTHLRSARAADIAVLPELCLPLVDAIEDALAATPADFPPLVVAGAQTFAAARRRGRDTSQRVPNLSRRRLRRSSSEGPPVPHQVLGGRRFARAVDEGSTPEQKTLTVLAGSFTRMAVVICADLNDGAVPMLLEQVGVNLLLVPALTSGSGWVQRGDLRLGLPLPGGGCGGQRTARSDPRRAAGTVALPDHGSCAASRSARAVSSVRRTTYGDLQGWLPRSEPAPCGRDDLAAGLRRQRSLSTFSRPSSRRHGEARHPSHRGRAWIRSQQKAQRRGAQSPQPRRERAPTAGRL